ncbi:MAG: ribulose-phosphate 3-epimerase [Lachnospiraceae bacterium]|jgi:ribulose-phosphate 3-epimerase|nr:ribulose-phosphate 3-epimerase [Lachnospiraceae bacterium]
MIILAPSILAADFTRLGEQVREVERSGAPYLHIDVMDGAFVPSISFGQPVIASLRPSTGMVFDVHMMVEDPGRYVSDMKAAGADIITVHGEACTHLDRVIHQIKETGCRAGVSLNPATPLGALEYILGDVDMVLLMTVNPGFGGQRFIPYMMGKIRELRELIMRQGHVCGIDAMPVASCTGSANAHVAAAGPAASHTGTPADGCPHVIDAMPVASCPGSANAHIAAAGLAASHTGTPADGRPHVIDIQVDGGVTLENAEDIIRAGANVLVAGSSVFRGDPGANVRAFLDIFAHAGNV